ncbi:MAG: transcriptional regulator, ArsR family [Acidimicrobiaceae bacterium]|nr:transcriptional regulator, ArsR family [Acidimicrobiaceae bacterium]
MRIVKHVTNYLGGLDRVLHALADPSRRAIVEQLALGPTSVSKLAAPLPMSLPSVLQHLAVLEQSGLVRSDKVGRVRTCHLQPAPLRRAEAWISEQRTEWEGRLDRLGQELAGQPVEQPDQQLGGPRV